MLKFFFTHNTERADKRKKKKKKLLPLSKAHLIASILDDW
jgi:hypothetical protein